MNRHVTAKSVVNGPGKQQGLDDLPNCLTIHKQLYFEHNITECPTCEMNLDNIDFTNQVGLGYFTGGL